MNICRHNGYTDIWTWPRFNPGVIKCIFPRYDTFTYVFCQCVTFYSSCYLFWQISPAEGNKLKLMTNPEREGYVMETVLKPLGIRLRRIKLRHFLIPLGITEEHLWCADLWENNERDVHGCPIYSQSALKIRPSALIFGPRCQQFRPECPRCW